MGPTTAMVTPGCTHLIPSDRVHEGCDSAEEGVDPPWHVHNETATEALDVVVLENVEDLEAGADRWVRRRGRGFVLPLVYRKAE